MSVAPDKVLRVTPPRGSDHELATNRDYTTGAGLLTAADLSITETGRRGVWMGHALIVGEPACHGTVADEAAMLELHDWEDDPHTRALYHYVQIGDSVLRADDPGYRWHCIAGHGTIISQWERRPLGNTVAEIRADLDSISDSVLDVDSGKIAGRASADSGPLESLTISQALDLIGTTAQGDLLYRGSSGWSRLPAGTAGHVLKSGGAGANPSWAAVSASGDVTGPASSTNETIPVFDGTTGKLLKAQSVASISSGVLRVKSAGANPIIHAVDESGTSQADITATTYGVNGGGIFHGRMANGTEASPTKVLSREIVAGFGGRGYYGTTGFHASSPASIHMVAAEAQENAAWGMYIRFLTTPIGSTTRNESALVCHDGTLWAHAASGVYDPRVSRQTKPVADVNILSSADSAASVGAFAYGGNTAGFRGGSAGGSHESPSATPSGAIISFMGGHVFDGSSWTIGTKALLAFRATQDASPTAQGTCITFDTTPNGSTSRAEAARVSPSGNILVGTTDDSAGFANASGNIKVKNSVVFEGGGTGRGIRYQATTAPGSVATTMGDVGPTGATAGPPSGWFRMYSGTAGRDVFVPFW